MRDKPDFKCYGKNYDPGLCKHCTHAAQCRNICQMILTAKKALPTVILAKALDTVSKMLQGGMPEWTRRSLSKMTFSHNGQEYGTDAIISGFLDGSLTFEGLVVERDANSAPLKKLGKPLSEVFAEEDEEKAMARRMNAARVHVKAKKSFPLAEALVQAEAECLDNIGMEECFDKGITYIVETHIRKDMLWAIDRFGERRECFRERFSAVMI